MVLKVTPDFRNACFWFTSTEHVGDRLAQFCPQGVEMDKFRARVPMDVKLVCWVTEMWRREGLSIQFLPEAKETWYWLNGMHKMRDDLELVPEGSSREIDGLYLHQRIALDFTLSHDHAGLFLEMGLGKTRVALHAAHARCAEGAGHLLVICPKTVMSTWRDEASKWLKWGDDEGENVFLVRGTKRQKERVLDTVIAFMRVEWSDVEGGWLPAMVVTNYETLLDAVLVRWLARQRWSLVVFDESTYLKGHMSTRSKTAWRAFRDCPHKMILTGEPITQGPEDLFSQMRVLNERVLGTKVANFRDRYCVLQGLNYGQGRFDAVVGYKNLNDLARKVYSTCVQFHARECLDLPEKTYEVRDIAMTLPQQRAYRQFSEEFVAWIGEREIIAEGILPRIAKLQQVTSGFVYDRNGATLRLESSPKIEALIELARELIARRKVIAWCWFTAEVDWATEALIKELGEGAVTWVDGRVTDADRDARLALFSMSPDVRVLVAQVATLGFGVNLQAASAAVYVTNPWSYERRTQSEARIHRIGQKENCLYVDLICPDTVDVSVLDALRRKANLGEQITSKQWERFVRGEIGAQSKP